MTQTRYAALLAFTGAVLCAIAGTLYALTRSTTLYALFTIAGTVCILVALAIAMHTQRQLVLKQAQLIARQRALERQLEMMLQQEEASKHG